MAECGSSVQPFGFDAFGVEPRLVSYLAEYERLSCHRTFGALT